MAALSDAQCEQLRQYVKRGGSLVATFETSLYDEWGTPRANFGLSDLFGAKSDGRVEGPMKNSYLLLRNQAGSENFHPLLRGLEDAGRIINGVRRVEASALRENFHPGKHVKFKIVTGWYASPEHRRERKERDERDDCNPRDGTIQQGRMQFYCMRKFL